MNRALALSATLLALATAAGPAAAYTLVLDMDATTAGIQSSVSVTAGSTVTVTGHLTSVSGGAIFDHLGFDLSWSKPGEGASLALVGGSPAAAGLAGVGAGPVLDLFTTGVVTPGSALTSGTLGVFGTNTVNVGGFGYYDTSFTGFDALTLPFGPAGTTIDAFTADFVVTGAVGSSVSLDPSGIFVPGFYTALPPMMVDGDAVWDSIVTLSTFSGVLTGGVVNVVPEPAGACLALLALAAVTRSRRIHRRKN